MNKLYVVHSSHPCEAVKEALALKGIAYKTVELPFPIQGALVRMRFRARSVPALRLEGGERVQGSVAIMRRLDELVADPPLLPAEEGARAQVLGAESWGAEVLQPLTRRILWGAMKRRTSAVPSFQAASQLPQFPRPVVRVAAPLIVRTLSAIHKADDDAVRADLRALPGHLDIVDDWIAAGVLGGPAPNAADLQIGSSLRLLSTIGDMRPLLEGRPCEELALRFFPVYPGDVPAGAYPSGWVPARA
ncbi:MAG TPA: glutathione S-transferase N-terminal domain-containing protein [Solirubrobacteraceae bacterium]|nr:glutathione S-transferase N-terminal domain-containing protein [Solirubrobacteraceae bacterium]